MRTKLLFLIYFIVLFGLFLIILGVGSLVLTTMLWEWFIPDVFSLAVKEGVLPRTLNPQQAFKVNCVSTVVFAILIFALYVRVNFINVNIKS